ncbi:MAG: MerR family transcriptional regulator, partial [Limisphaerales bacterium]
MNPIQRASRLTGLSPNLIRAWEHRYGAVEPGRTSSKRRLYSQSDIERLRLLKELTASGHAISQIAKLPDAKLRELTLQSPSRLRSQSPATETDTAAVWLNEALGAIQDLDAQRLESTLKNSGAALGTHGSLLRVIAPLAERVGELWRAGELSAAHEHFGSSVMRAFLQQLAKPFGGNDRSPLIVVATPAGQLHEL